MPRFLRKLKVKHAAMAKMELQKKTFAAIHHVELVEMDSVSPDANLADVCWQCGEASHVHGRLVNIEHANDGTSCSCKMHEACLAAWTRVHEAKGKRVKICPACRCKRKGWQPQKYGPALCGAVVIGGVCKKRLGHLGNCVRGIEE